MYYEKVRPAWNGHVQLENTQPEFIMNHLYYNRRHFQPYVITGSKQ